MDISLGYIISGVGFPYSQKYIGLFKRNGDWPYCLPLMAIANFVGIFCRKCWTDIVYFIADWTRYMNKLVQLPPNVIQAQAGSLSLLFATGFLIKNCLTLKLKDACKNALHEEYFMANCQEQHSLLLTVSCMIKCQNYYPLPLVFINCIFFHWHVASIYQFIFEATWNFACGSPYRLKYLVKIVNYAEYWRKITNYLSCQINYVNITPFSDNGNILHLVAKSFISPICKQTITSLYNNSSVASTFGNKGNALGMVFVTK